MSEFRDDDLTGRTVIVAAARAARPHTVATSSAPSAGGADCPFCPGNERETPPEVARLGPGDPDTPGWRVRIVPNLYPIVDGSAPGTEATGAHEVVILGPDHRRAFGDLDDDAAVDVLCAMRDRAHAHLEHGHSSVASIINHGRAAGASIAHPHAQLIALDVIPVAVADALARVARRPDHDLVIEDLHRDPALVVGDGPAPWWCPWGSGAPFTVRIAHPQAGPSFEVARDDHLVEVAHSLRDALARLGRVVGADLAYNVVVHTVPPEAGRFHWYVEVTPRLSVVAGFEVATGILVNTMPPETAAQTLRSAG